MTLIDTPGHAAFSGMRQRGAKSVDCVILVVDATDAVQPQTKESLAIIRQEGVPFVVALNKCDRDSAEPDKIQQELESYGVDPSDTDFIRISALKGDNINELLETVELYCEMQDPRADPNGNAELLCLESTRTEDGSAAKCILLNGCLEPRTYVVAGKHWARVTRIRNDKGELLDNDEKALPSMPVEINGFKEMPETGLDVIEVPNQKIAELVIRNRKIDEYENSEP
eukprot:UN25084